MALNEIPYGGEIRSQPLNENFQYLDQRITTHENKDASLTQKGHVQLSNAIDSSSQSLAATSKAVNDALDWVRSFGLGAEPPLLSDANLPPNTPTSFFKTDTNTLNVPLNEGTLLHIARDSRPTQQYIDFSTGRMFTRSYTSSGWRVWEEVGRQVHKLTQDNGMSFNLGADGFDLNDLQTTGLYSGAFLVNVPPSAHTTGTVLHLAYRLSGFAVQLYFTNTTADYNFWYRRQREGNWDGWVKIWNTSNTIVDANGFIKEA